MILPLHSQTVVPLWCLRKGCAGSRGRAARSGLRLPAGSGGELVGVGGSEGKDKATCVAASEGEREKKKLLLHASASAPLSERNARKEEG